MSRPRSVLIAHPSADVYGSDLQLLETVSAITGAGWEAHVVLPVDGPLVPRLRDRGAQVTCSSFPVLRKSLISPRGVLSLLVSILRALPAMVRHVRQVRADTVLVNTVTIPWWILAGRLTRRKTVVHVHEAEEDGSRIVLTALALPNLLAHQLVVNSRSSAEALARPVPRLLRRITVVHNGMPGPDSEPTPVRARTPDDPAVVLLVARLSPRKGVDVALESVASLRRAGRSVRLIVCGSVFPGYEWFEKQLRERADADDLTGAVELRGYVDSTWPLLAQSDVVIVPSRVEPFGNTAVEALLAQRPLVASDVQGLAEIVRDDVNGLLAIPGDAQDLARQMARLLDSPDMAARLARAGRQDALARFSPEAYGSAMLRLLG